MTSVATDPPVPGDNPPPKHELTVRKHQHDRPDPGKPSVAKVDGVWFAQVYDMNTYPHGYLCLSAWTQPDAFAKVPELMAALARRQLGWTEE